MSLQISSLKESSESKFMKTRNSERLKLLNVEKMEVKYNRGMSCKVVNLVFNYTDSIWIEAIGENAAV